MKYMAVVFLLVSFSALAHKPQLNQDCFKKAVTQMEMTSCANAKAEKPDKELNETYHRLLSYVKSQKNVADKIIAMESAWITYRDQYMIAMYPAKDKQAEYGSMYPMEANLLNAKLTREHIADLKLLLTQYGPSDR